MGYYNKYKSKKVYLYQNGTASHENAVYGLGSPVEVFDSTKEFARWKELRLMERAGKITGLKRQVKYELIPNMKSASGATIRGISYVADFIYTDDKGGFHVEDVKGMRTEVYKLKKKLMLYTRGIELEEV